MGYNRHLTAIQAVLDGVSAVGRVHGYERWESNWSDFLSHFQASDGTIRGVSITRTGVHTRQITHGQKERAHVWAIRFVAGLSDDAATEQTFQLAIDLAVAAFDADETLGGAVETTHPDWGPMSGAVGLQIATIEPRMFGRVLCHYGEGRLCTVELVSC